MTSLEEVAAAFTDKTIPNTAGFYLADGSYCKYANSQQISKKKWKLEHDLYYRAKDGRLFVVRAGFIHDGASKWILRHFGDYTNAAILHDALYGSEIVPRGDADDLFLEGMKVLGVPWYTRYTYYYAVVAIGWSVYGQHTEASVADGRKFIDIF